MVPVAPITSKKNFEKEEQIIYPHTMKDSCCGYSV